MWGVEIVCFCFFLGDRKLRVTCATSNLPTGTGIPEIDDRMRFERDILLFNSSSIGPLDLKIDFILRMHYHVD